MRRTTSEESRTPWRSRGRIKTSGSLDHLGYRKEVGLYDNDSQIKEVHFREVESDRASYTVTLRDLDRPASG